MKIKFIIVWIILSILFLGVLFIINTKFASSSSFINNATILRINSINSNMTFSLNTTLDYLETTSNYIYILNATTSLGFCPLINFSTPNSTLDSKDFCLTAPVGGGGGGTGISPKIINSTLCNYTYDYVNDYGTDYSLIDLQIEKIKSETNLTFEWTETRDYIDNWQSYCSDNINRSLKENLICSKAKESKDFRNDSRMILNITESLKDEIIISTNLFNYYIDNYNSLCEELKPFSITTTKGKVSLLVLLIFLVFILLIVVLQYKERILILLSIKKKRDKIL